MIVSSWRHDKMDFFLNSAINVFSTNQLVINLLWTFVIMFAAVVKSLYSRVKCFG